VQFIPNQIKFLPTPLVMNGLDEFYGGWRVGQGTTTEILVAM